MKTKKFDINYEKYNESIRDLYGAEDERELENLRQILNSEGISPEFRKGAEERLKELEKKRSERNKIFSRIAIR